MIRACMVMIGLLSVLPAGIAHGAGSDPIQITIENRSTTSVLLQVKDEVCTTPVSDACTQADFIIKSMECQKTPLPDVCIRAQQKLEGGNCVEGLIYERNVAAGEKVSLSICINPSGYGRVSMRDLSRNTLWKSSLMVNNGDRLSYP